MKVAKERKSSVLASNAVHHRVDSLTGIVTLFAILGANFLHNAAWLDPVGGFFISLLVIKAGWGNTVSALAELADKGIDSEMKASVTRAFSKSLANLENESQIELREVEGVKSGQNYLVDLQIAVPKSSTVEEVRVIEEAIREAVGSKVRGIRRVKCRFVPQDDTEVSLFDEAGPQKSRMIEDIVLMSFQFVSRNRSPSPEPEELDHDHEGHDHDHDHSHTHANRNGNGKKSL